MKRVHGFTDENPSVYQADDFRIDRIRDELLVVLGVHKPSHSAQPLFALPQGGKLQVAQPHELHFGEIFVRDDEIVDFFVLGRSALGWHPFAFVAGTAACRKIRHACLKILYARSGDACIFELPCKLFRKLARGQRIAALRIFPYPFFNLLGKFSRNALTRNLLLTGIHFSAFSNSNFLALF